VQTYESTLSESVRTPMNSL